MARLNREAREILCQMVNDRAKAKQEIILRVALGMNYDEVVEIVNGFEF